MFNLEKYPYQHLFAAVIIILAVGITFYHFVEHLSWLNAYYFSVITLATVGYGDITPKTDIGYILPILIVIFWGLALWLSPIKNWVVWVMCIGVDLAMIVLSFMVIYGRSYYINQPLRPPFTSEVASTLYDAFTQPLWFVIVFLFILSLFTMWALRSYRNTHIA